MRRPSDQRGLTLLELVMTAAILAILAAAAMPLYEVSVRREREVELRHGLRVLRRAIDAFHGAYVCSGGATGMPGSALPGAASGTPFGGAPNVPGGPGGVAGGRSRGAPGAPGAAGGPCAGVEVIDVSRFDPIDSKGYPPDLELLVEGVPASGGTDEDLIYFLRRIPRDPMMSADDIDDNDPNFGWGVRSYQDGPDTNSWGRQNVYDVYTKSTGKPLDGIGTYRDW